MLDFIKCIRFWWNYRHVPHPASREFLQTYEWARVRYQVLHKYRDKPCMACARWPKQGVWLNVDHIKPHKTHLHLSLDINNLLILCHECNRGKGNWDNTDWRSAQPSTRISFCCNLMVE
jgi:5-methylcytosine-specific restriction endonuclease McrA